MKRRIERRDTDKISISLPLAMIAWLKEEAGRKQGSVSEVIRECILTAKHMDASAGTPLPRQRAGIHAVRGDTRG